MALALQRSPERWFCKIETCSDLNFVALGTRYLLTSISKLVMLAILALGKEKS